MIILADRSWQTDCSREKRPENVIVLRVNYELAFRLVRATYSPKYRGESHRSDDLEHVD